MIDECRDNLKYLKADMNITKNNVKTSLKLTAEAIKNYRASIRQKCNRPFHSIRILCLD